MQVRLLGPVDVLVDGGARPVRGPRRKAVLAALALSGGEVVSTSRLVDVVWGDTAPPAAANALQRHVSDLRALLGCKSAILERPPGYVLGLAGGGTDVQLAEQLLRQGTKSADPVQGGRHLRAALALWRGRPLEDLAGLGYLEDHARRLDLLRLRVERALVDAGMAAGEHTQLLPELEQMVADNPLDERLHAQLMRALYRSGRQADALAAYQRLRRTLADELGIDPSQVLRDLETAILRQDASLDGPAPAGAVTLVRQAMPIPAQLPSAVPAFAGRDRELASLDAMLSGGGRAGSTQPPAVPISVLSGTAGVGKTALAVQWAHRVSDRFPDGQLYVNLRGFDPRGPAVEPADAVRGFLEAFGVPVTRIPRGLPAQTALYRSLLAGQRVLVVLDNARDAEQARPLLPGSPGCFALVTSRDRLTGLVAGENARPMTLDLLTPAGARELLAGRLGQHRVASEPDAVDDIIAGCALLPLALAIVAARAASSPSFPLAVFAAQLRAAARVLDPFHGGDGASDVRAVFSWSYHCLGPGAARLFRLLGLHAGPDISAAAAASLAAISTDQALVLLDELTRRHLLTEHSPGRYACHDLLRAYASELASAHDSQQARAEAVRRMLEHYLHSAHGAAKLIQPHLEPLALIPARPGVVITGEPATLGDAVSWFSDESATLLAAIRLAAEADSDAHTWQLAWTLSAYLLRRGRWHEQATAWELGLAAARRAGDEAGEAHALHGLAEGYSRSGRSGDADSLFRQALRQFEAISGHLSSQAAIHNSLTCLAERQHRPADALSHAQAALEKYRAAGYRPGQAWVLNNIGYSYAQLGNYQQAITYCERALAGIQELGEPCWEAATWDSFGFIHHQLGDYQQAVTCYERSVDLCQEVADCSNEAHSLDHLGDVHLSAGDPDAARSAWTRAQLIWDAVGHPAGELTRAKLRGPAVPVA
ncbi:MAG TPA: BTAD domain-containing putative transcriptional regulator [Streptosporangiaceae bacterium]|jgi:DNA-binding SARP family transcriptional activator